MKKSTVVLIRNAYQFDYGGGERFPVFLAMELKKHDYEPLIVSRSQRLLSFAALRDIKTIKGWWWSRQNWSGWRMSLFPVYLLWQLTLTMWYLKVFYTVKPQVVHVQSKDDFIGASVAAKLCGAKVIWTDHADLKHVWQNVEKPLRNLVGKTVLWASRYTEHIAVVSDSEKNLVSENITDHPLVSEKLVVVHNGVEDRYPQYPSQHKDGQYVFCIASRLVVDKGIGEVIEAFRTLHSEFPDTRLMIMGDGPDKGFFDEKAEDVEAISMLGHTDDPLKVMSTSDAFVHPTYHEGFSVALVEASMMGLPIIATNVGGNPEIIKDDQTGLLVPARDTNELKLAMKKLYLDQDLAKHLGQNARDQYLEKFEFSKIVQNDYLPLYNRS